MSVTGFRFKARLQETVLVRLAVGQGTDGLLSVNIIERMYAHASWIINVPCLNGPARTAWILMSIPK